MKSHKSLLTAIVTAVLFAAPGLPVMANNVEERDAPQDFTVSDAGLPQAKLPILKIGGKENADVYLQSLDIQVEVTGSVASTRYTMVFKNRANRILEGELTFPLPDGRTVTHYALDINGKMREAVPVEKAKAAQVFEEIQRREVDPGILERVEGNNFRTRIYPIPANGARTVTIGYEEELALEKELLYYRLPMAYPDPLEKFAVKATVWKGDRKPLVPKSEDEIRFDRAGENYVASFARENYRPSRALIFALPVFAEIPQVMMQSAQGSHYFLASIAPKVKTRKKQWDDELAIVWDVSLSGSQRNLQREMEMLDIIFAEKKNVSVHLYFLNNKLRKSVNKNTGSGEYKVAKGDWDELKKVLETAVFDGGTDFSKIKLKDITGNEILFFSDGLSTLSDADFLGIIADNGAVSEQGRPQGSPLRGHVSDEGSPLHDRVSDVCRGGACPRPIHCIVSSSKADYSVMKLIAGRTKGKFVNINALSSENLKHELLNEALQFLGTEHGEAMREVYPSIATPVHGNFSLAGISDANNAELTLLFGFGDKVEKRVKVKLDAKKADKQGNVYKIWAQKKIAELDLNYEKNRAELTELGQQFGIVTRNTSLMVLELVDDYVRYNIEPPASEPELLAEYQKRLKGREEQRRNAERSMLNEAVASAERLKKWWETDFTPKKPKYPTPDGAKSPGGSGPVITAVVMGEAIMDEEDQPARRDAESTVAAQRTGSAAGRPSNQNQPASRSSTASTAVTGKLMLPKRAGIKIYENEVPEAYEHPVATVGPNDILMILEIRKTGFFKRTAPGVDRRTRFKVRTTSGAEGFVLKRDVVRAKSTVKASTIKRGLAFETYDVEGYLDSPTPVYILDVDDPNADPITLDGPSLSGFRGSSRSRSDDDDMEMMRMRSELEGDDEPRNYSRDYSRSGRLHASSSEAPPPPSSADNIRKKKDEEKQSQPTITVKPVKQDNEYLKKLTGKTADDYQTYLKLREDYSSSPTFYFDMADWFYRHKDRETALRILTSIAELELENASLYRLLGYRFKEYGEYTLQKFVCKKVVQWRPMDPQSHRDYALALADNGEAQAALDSLGRVLTRLYPSANINNRNHGIDEVVVTEINRLIAKNPHLNTSKIDKRLIANIPVDVRVVINWNMNNTDIDLHVKDPNGEECYYGRTATSTGGRISADNVSGYGPEQFILKNAVKGKYQVSVNYFSSREFTPDGPSTVMAEIYVKYSDKTEQRQVVCLQMSKVEKKSGKVEVAEFEF